MFQGTVSKVTGFTGVGLHSGRLIEIKICPAEPNFGIQFLRTDLEGAKPLLAHPSNVISTSLCTSIGDNFSEVGTIEHLMAAFQGIGVDNALVEINAPELPILDGSAAPFLDRLIEAGVQTQNIKRKSITLEDEVFVGDDDQWMKLTPSSSQNLVITYTIDFSRSKAIGRQTLVFNTSQPFVEVCEARTFCHIDDVTAMREQGLALGGSLDNAVVVDSCAVVNSEGLRYEDEFVRHKLLDCLGDLALLGASLTGSLEVFKGGHKLHNQFTKIVLSKCEEEILRKEERDSEQQPSSFVDNILYSNG